MAQIGRYLGAGFATLVNIFEPELIVIGGGFGRETTCCWAPRARCWLATGSRPGARRSRSWRRSSAPTPG